MNENNLEFNHLGIKHFFSLYKNTCRDGDLSLQTKELSDLVTSTELHQNDCTGYHLEQCAKVSSAKYELTDASNTARIAGESSAIPHFRHEEVTMELLEAEGAH